MVKIESAYLNADQEQKLNNLCNVSEKYTGRPFKQFSQRIPRGLGSMRVLFEAMPNFDALCGVEEALLEAGQKVPDEVKFALDGYVEVFNHEYKQVMTGTQEFVPEYLERFQK